MVDVADKLKTNSIPKQYFKDGNTIQVGVSYHIPYNNEVGHYIVIVREATFSLDLGAQKYYPYLADDPWYRQVYVLVPYANEDTLKLLKNKYSNISTRANYYTLNGKPLFVLGRDYAKALRTR